MEPSSVQKTGGRGSLESPEVYENVPGHVIPIIAGEFDDFDTEAKKFLDGETPENQFIGFRLKQGVYGQRQAGVNMVRIKLPMGGVTPEQLEAVADVTEEFAPLNKAHITTRQNFQIHHVPLADMAKLIRHISDSGLSSREGCGNTVRNVTGDPYAGLFDDEAFDLTPYAGAFVRYFVRHPTTQLMPRKIKTAFDGTAGVDRSLTGIHDIAFIARERDGVKGVEVRVGGGTSIMPRVAPTLYEFVELENGEYLEVAEAVFRIFDRTDFLRVNRARARIKVLVDKIGMDEFRKLVDEERKGDWVAERHFDVAGLRMDIDEAASAVAKPETYASPNGDLSEFERWKASNVMPQKQEGFSAVEARIVRGDLDPTQLRELAAIAREYSGGWVRTTVHQNVVLRWVRDEHVYEVWKRLSAMDAGRPGVNQVQDVVSCPGTDSCKLGITSSMGLNRAVMQRIEEMEITDPLTSRIHVKMSGCPNGCSQHHIGNIGFYGASIKVGTHTMPAYVAHIGGNYEGGNIVYGGRLKVRLPAKRVPEAVERWLRMYEAERADDTEVFNAFVERVGLKRFEDEVRELGLPAEFSLQTMDEFIDWTKKEPFVVQRGEGECAV